MFSLFSPHHAAGWGEHGGLDTPATRGAALILCGFASHLQGVCQGGAGRLWLGSADSTWLVGETGG